MPKLRYRLHWNSNRIEPYLDCKWVIYDWKTKSIKQVAFVENREIGRQICNLLNKWNSYQK